MPLAFSPWAQFEVWSVRKNSDLKYFTYGQFFYTGWR